MPIVLNISTEQILKKMTTYKLLHMKLYKP